MYVGCTRSIEAHAERVCVNLAVNGLLLVAVGIRTTGMNGLVLLAVGKIRPLDTEQKIGRGVVPERDAFPGAKKAGFAVGKCCRLFSPTTMITPSY